MHSYYVVFHVDENERWGVTLTNVTNTLDSGDDIGIAVLANSEAVRGLLPGAEGAARIGPLSDRGVEFIACRNALRALGIAPDSLPAFVMVVPSGVVELVKRQAAGYAYIRP